MLDLTPKRLAPGPVHYSQITRALLNKGLPFNLVVLHMMPIQPQVD